MRRGGRSRPRAHQGAEAARDGSISGSAATATGRPSAAETLAALLDALAPGATLGPLGRTAASGSARQMPDPDARQSRQVHEIDRHNQQLLAESRRRPQGVLLAKLDTGVARHVQDDRRALPRGLPRRGHRPLRRPAAAPRRPHRARSTTSRSTSATRSCMDVFPDVIAYGILLVPKGIKDGEKRPVVVCQHGLEGRPQDVADPKVDSPYYHQFAVKLAERGFVTFAPQNLVHLRRPLPHPPAQGEPARKTLFSVIVPQHQQITDWLKTLPVRRSRPDRLLRPELRRQVGHAHPAAGRRTTACRSARPTSTSGSGRTPRRARPTATSGRTSTRSSSSTSATRSTTPRWPR